ncbi:hypothetical protein F2Q69_00050966 [Brassica cretica]|uniref:Uncharacterized protein n=1 Tax=Brassica cretica TaxID=69181 RepID=A0A8S9PNB0_BRACR|nr:hypothetical protein F2Q69_00050966 [Brassica cretica]
MADTEYTLVDGAVLLPRSFPPNWLRYFLMFPRLERHGVEVKVGDTFESSILLPFHLDKFSVFLLLCFKVPQRATSAAGELKGEGFADAVGGAGDDGPGAVAAEVLGGAEEVDVEGIEEGECEFEELEGAEGEEEEEPRALGFEVSAEIHEFLGFGDGERERERERDLKRGGRIEEEEGGWK